MTRYFTSTAALLAGALLALSGCATTPAAPAGSSPALPATSLPAEPPASPGPAMAPGSYLTYQDYQAKMAMLAGTDVVLFFHAPWCPDCKATDESLAGDGVPEGLTVVKVDYDTMTDLKKKYGITQQHTFVQIGEEGEKLMMWTGSATGESIMTTIS